MTFAPSHRHTVWTCTSHTVTYAHRLNLDKRSPSPLRTTSEPPQNKLQQKNKRSNFHPAIDQLNDEVGHVRETKKIKKIQKKMLPVAAWLQLGCQEQVRSWSRRARDRQLSPSGTLEPMYVYTYIRMHVYYTQICNIHTHM